MKKLAKLYTVSFHMVDAVWAFKLYKKSCIMCHPMSHPTFSNQNRIWHVASNMSDRVSQALLDSRAALSNSYLNACSQVGRHFYDDLWYDLSESNPGPTKWEADTLTIKPTWWGMYAE